MNDKTYIFIAVLATLIIVVGLAQIGVSIYRAGYRAGVDHKLHVYVAGDPPGYSDVVYADTTGGIRECTCRRKLP